MIVKTYKNGNVHIKLEKDELCSALYSDVKTNIDTFIYALNSQVDIHSWYNVGVFNNKRCKPVFLDTTELVYTFVMDDIEKTLNQGKTLILQGKEISDLQAKRLQERFDIDCVDGVFCYPLPF